MTNHGQLLLWLSSHERHLSEIFDPFGIERTGHLSLRKVWGKRFLDFFFNSLFAPAAQTKLVLSARGSYSAQYKQARDGTWSGTVAEFPILFASGKTLDLAQADMQEALEIYIEELDAAELFVTPPSVTQEAR